LAFAIYVSLERPLEVFRSGQRMQVFRDP